MVLLLLLVILAGGISFGLRGEGGQLERIHIAWTIILGLALGTAYLAGGKGGLLRASRLLRQPIQEVSSTSGLRLALLLIFAIVVLLIARLLL